MWDKGYYWLDGPLKRNTWRSPRTTLTNDDWNLILIELDMRYSNTNCALFFKYIIRANVAYSIICRDGDSRSLSIFNGKLHVSTPPPPPHECVNSRRGQHMWEPCYFAKLRFQDYLSLPHEVVLVNPSNFKIGYKNPLCVWSYLSFYACDGF